ncbi:MULTISPECIES: DUF397 domain-containing protein [unclassified Streptomyces]|uniref:DUF397 domain-containing protein n=2 Tax=Streptomyces TaxID=1883 RepID=UPI00382BA32F
MASLIESGRYGVSAERVRRLAAHCSATDEHLVNVLAAMAEERGKGWWEEYRGRLSPGFPDLAELEHHALHPRAIDMLHAQVHSPSRTGNVREMTDPTAWQKSSFSGADNNQNCVRVSLSGSGTIELVESAIPEAIVATSRANFAAFVRGVEAGEFDHLIEAPVQG